MISPTAKFYMQWLMAICIMNFAFTAYAYDAVDTTVCANESVAHQTSPIDDDIPIDSIAINIHPVFDENNPEENNWIFRLVNKLHIDTHKRVIEQDLQFKAGDKIDEKILAESERLLRTRRYLNSASVTNSTDCNHKKTVNVDVREVWTLVPEITYSHTGGNSNYGFGLHDSNFLGLGKSVNITHSVTTERTSDLVEYYDPNIGLGDATFATQYANNSDGKQQSFALIKPFTTLDTDWAAGISHESLTEEDTLYRAGKEVDRFARDNANQTIFYGRKLSIGNKDSIHRLSIGYSQWEDKFSSVGVAPKVSSLVPDGRQYNYPWIEYAHIYDGFIEAKNIQQINRIEDINLGAQVRVRLGYTASRYELNDKNLMFETEYSQGLQLSSKQLLLGNITATGFDDGKHIYNTLINMEASYHWQNMQRGQFYLAIKNQKGTHLFDDLPLELGGETGLRGYPIRYVAGEHLQLVTVEQRYFGEKEWLSLFHLGAAIFYDQGRVFGASAIPQYNQHWLRDVGIGLRISGTRNGNMEEGAHNILHIDVASPLDGSNDIAKVQWLVKVKKSF
jgi:hypothetical protein